MEYRDRVEFTMLALGFNETSPDLWSHDLIGENVITDEGSFYINELPEGLTTKVERIESEKDLYIFMNDALNWLLK